MPLFLGDCLDVLKTLEPNSIDSLVTDPPAGISFMGKDWDHHKGGRDEWVKWMTEIMQECARVMKPGAHGLVWALPRTSHWTATALEDAGFEVRDVVTHLFGTGFPKSLDISKAIDKAAGAEREVIGSRITDDIRGGALINQEHKTHVISITVPSTSEAKQWQGWGTALKPASEHWILIRKPCSEKTVAANVLKHGTGGINIDDCRISGQFESGWSKSGSKASDNLAMSGANYDRDPKPDNPQGRFPANLVLDEVAAEMLDEQSLSNGIHSAGKKRPSCEVKHGDNSSIFGISGHESNGMRFGDSGGASRFFYVAKASKLDRNEGLEGMPEIKSGMMEDDNYPIKTGSGNLRDTKNQNHHPTVKSTKLMSYLCKLVTPPGGTILDPFMGSGSTGKAAKQLGFEFIGIEQNQEYFEIAKRRVK